MLQRRHDAFGKQANIFESHLLRHAAKMKSAGECRDAAFFVPAPNRVAAALRIAGDDKAPRHVRTDIVFGQTALGIGRLVKIGVIFMKGTASRMPRSKLSET